MLTQKIFAAAQGGADSILYLLLATSVVSVAMIIERWWVLRAIRSNSLRIKRKMEEALQGNTLADLEEIAKDRDTLEGRAVSYALRQVKDKSAAGAEEIFNSFIVMQRPQLERFLSFLATVGSNGPFVGLLGTVLGIMKAFNDLGANASDPSVVMVGIAEALVATAVGLFVAIPAVIAYNYFQRQVKYILQSLEGVKELSIAYIKTK
ncbi:MAG: MotA/TolQ/ExbB proton channel family protein [Bdellovibrionales bacterium]|nr:MotA/TolQ/ExbB proton channel family protein [Bdellovibrionales bacterium]